MKLNHKTLYVLCYVFYIAYSIQCVLYGIFYIDSIAILCTDILLFPLSGFMVYLKDISPFGFITLRVFL